MIGRRRYRAAQRLRTADLRALLAGGRVIRQPGFTVLVKANGLGIPRFNVIVPKRIVPRAVDRNRMKRRLREWLRNHQELLGARDISIRVSRSSMAADQLAKVLK